MEERCASCGLYVGAEKPIRFTIKIRDIDDRGKQYWLRPYEKISLALQKYATEKEVEVDDLTLQLRRRFVHPDSTPAGNNMQHGDVLTVMHKTGQLLSWDLLSDSRDYRLCTLQDLCTEAFVTDMRVHLDDPVKVVRKQWEEITGVSWKNIMVYYEGKLIRAKTTFRDIGLKDGDAIFMVGKTVFTKIGTV